MQVIKYKGRPTMSFDITQMPSYERNGEFDNNVLFFL